MLVNLREMLADASAKKYAVGMFDVSDLEMIRAVVQEAESLRSPVILGALAPDLQGDRLEYWFALASLAAKKAKVPVCIHLDHANTLDEVMRAADIGFSSVMLDASASPFEENIRRSKEVVQALSGRDITVEAELGHVGNGWVGSGVYIKAPELDIARLQKITEASDIPLVLHGGSGTPEDQLRAAITNGICKINIYSEMLTAWNTAMLNELQKLPHMAAWPGVLRKNPDAAMRAVIREKIGLFGSNGKF